MTSAARETAAARLREVRWPATAEVLGGGVRYRFGALDLPGALLRGWLARGWLVGGAPYRRGGVWRRRFRLTRAGRAVLDPRAAIS